MKEAGIDISEFSSDAMADFKPEDFDVAPRMGEWDVVKHGSVPLGFFGSGSRFLQRAPFFGTANQRGARFVQAQGGRVLRGTVFKG